MLIRLLTVLVFLLLASFPPASARGAGASSLPVRAQIQDHGVQLSLAMPRGPYAWNSFVPVAARVENISARIVKVGFTEEGLSCFIKGPVVEVRRQNGTIVFPPSVLHAQPLPCPSPPLGIGVPLRPRAGMTWTGYVILRAAHILARVAIVRGKQTVGVSTPVVTVTLHVKRAPRVALHTDGEVFADLAHPADAPGPMLAAWWCRCTARATRRHSAGEVITRPGVVTAVRGTRLTPHLDHEGCIRLIEWHAVAGWSGFPAASVDYVAPSTERRHYSVVAG